MKAVNVANYFLLKSDPDVGDFLTNLKIQKLVYYAQGLHLALYDRPLFDEPIEAWAHGPVVPDLYHHFKEYRSSPIPIPVEFEPNKEFGQETLEFLDEVYEVYGQFSAWKLRDMTHEEAPWVNTHQNGVIDHSRLKEYFTDQVYE